MLWLQEEFILQEGRRGCLGVQRSRCVGRFGGSDWRTCAEGLCLAFAAHGPFPPP